MTRVVNHTKAVAGGIAGLVAGKNITQAGRGLEGCWPGGGTNLAYMMGERRWWHIKQFICSDCDKEEVFKSLKAGHHAGWTGNPNTTENERCPECHEYLEDLDALAKRQAESLIKR